MTTNQDAFYQLVEGIESHLTTNCSYNFRPVQIDGINLYMVLYGKYNILNVESIYITCKVDIDGEMTTQKYSLYHYKYKSIRDALDKVSCIRSGYRIYNGELVCSTDYKMMKLEEKTVLPYSDDECCVVCYENTSDITECKHAICLECREKCILRKQPDCPVCRSTNGLVLYNNRSDLVNNDAYDVLKKAIHSENTNTTSASASASASIYIPQSHEDSSEDDEEDDEEDDNEAYDHGNTQRWGYDETFHEGDYEREYEPNFDFTDNFTVLFDSSEISQISVHDDDENSEIDEISEFLSNM